MDNFLDLLRNDHQDFDKGKLEDQFGNNPMELFARWLREAIEKEVSEPNAVAISTLNLEDFPTSRIVYLKDILEEGFVFYTNYNSQKGKAIEENSKVGALLFWPDLERQISISGFAEKIPAEMSDAYFKERPRLSQLGAWASFQSEELESRQELEERVLYFSEKYTGIVPRPPHWGGYLVKPIRFEFWQGRPSRLHDRIVFTFVENQWNISRLNP